MRIQIEIISDINAVMCTLSLYDISGITHNLHIKLESFSHIAEHLNKEAVRGSSFLDIIAKKSVIMSEAFLVDVSILYQIIFVISVKMNGLAQNAVVFLGLRFALGFSKKKHFCK